MEIRPPPISVLAAALLVLPARPAPAAEGGDGAKGFRFAWPVPCRGSVVETVEKRGKTVLRYDVVFDRRKAGEGYELSVEGIEFREVMGIDLTREENRKKFAPVLAQALPLLGAVPRLAIDARGEVEDVIGIEEATRTALGLMEKLPGADPAVIEATGKALRSPPVIAQMKQTATDFWHVWVHAWVGLDLAPGGETEAEHRVPMPDGTVLRTRSKIRHLGPDPAGGGLVALSLEAALSGEEARKALARTMEAMLKRLPAGKAVAFSPDMVEEFTRTTKAWVATDPRTLVPARARVETTSTVAIKGQDRRTETERHEYVFSWPK